MLLAKVVDMDLSVLSQLNSSLSLFSMQSRYNSFKQIRANNQIDQHDVEVARLSRQVGHLSDESKVWRACYSSHHGFALDDGVIDVSFGRLNTILKVSAIQKTVLVEPGVKFAVLIEEIKRHGLKLPTGGAGKEGHAGMTTGEALQDSRISSDCINWAGTIDQNGDIKIHRQSLDQPLTTDGNSANKAAYTLFELRLT